MNMDRSTAEQWVTISAALVIGIYAYRRLTEPASGPASVKKLAGVGPPVPLGSFATAWGFMFLVIAVMAQASPGLGGSFAVLVATGDLLTNAPAITSDVSKKVAGKTSSSTTPATVTSTGGTMIVAGLTNPNKAAGTVQQGVGNVDLGLGGVFNSLGGTLGLNSSLSTPTNLQTVR